MVSHKLYVWVGGRLVCACMHAHACRAQASHRSDGLQPLTLPEDQWNSPLRCPLDQYFFEKTAKPVLSPCLLVSVLLQAKGNDCLCKCWNQTSHDNTEQMAVVLFNMVSISHTKKPISHWKASENLFERKTFPKNQDLGYLHTQKETKSERATGLGRETREEIGKGILTTAYYD